MLVDTTREWLVRRPERAWLNKQIVRLSFDEAKLGDQLLVYVKLQLDNADTPVSVVARLVQNAPDGVRRAMIEITLPKPWKGGPLVLVHLKGTEEVARQRLLPHEVRLITIDSFRFQSGDPTKFTLKVEKL